MKPVYYFVSVPPAICVLESHQHLDSDRKSSRSFSKIKRELIAELRDDIRALKYQIREKKKQISKVRQKTGPFDWDNL